MIYKVSIVDYGKFIRIIILLFSSLIVLISTFSLALEYKIIDHNKIPFEIVFPGIIIFILIFLILSLRSISSYENLLLEKDKIISNKFGIIEFRNIRKYKLLEFRGAGTLIITMENGRKFGVGPRNGLTNAAQRDFDDFYFFLKTEIINKPILEEKSKLEFYFGLLTTIAIVLFDIFLLYLVIVGKDFSKEILLINVLLIFSILKLLKK